MVVVSLDTVFVRQYNVLHGGCNGPWTTYYPFPHGGCTPGGPIADDHKEQLRGAPPRGVPHAL